MRCNFYKSGRAIQLTGDRQHADFLEYLHEEIRFRNGRVFAILSGQNGAFLSARFNQTTHGVNARRVPT